MRQVVRQVFLLLVIVFGEHRTDLLGCVLAFQFAAALLHVVSRRMSPDFGDFAVVNNRSSGGSHDGPKALLHPQVPLRATALRRSTVLQTGSAAVLAWGLGRRRGMRRSRNFAYGGSIERAGSRLSMERRESDCSGQGAERRRPREAVQICRLPGGAVFLLCGRIEDGGVPLRVFGSAATQGCPHTSPRGSERVQPATLAPLDLLFVAQQPRRMTVVALYQDQPPQREQGDVEDEDEDGNVGDGQIGVLRAGKRS